MIVFENILKKIKKIPTYILGIIALFILAGFLLIFNEYKNMRATSAIPAQIRFEGEYRIGENEWQNIVPGKHISSTQGDVTLKGNFHLYLDGEYLGVFDGNVPIALYSNHICLQVKEGDNIVDLDVENRLFGSSSCGVFYDAYEFIHDGTQPIEIIIHNPHKYGNELAIDQLLSNFAIWNTIDFEKEILNSGEQQRNIGMVFLVVAIALLGTALFGKLLHVQKVDEIGLLGFTILFAGIYFLYSSNGVSIWSESIIFNTTILGISMMFYMLFILGIVTSYLVQTKKIGIIITFIIGIVDAICFLIPIVTDVYFYDAWMYWVVIQTIANIIVLGCLMKDLIFSKIKNYGKYIGLTLLLVSFEIDIIATKLGIWEGGRASRCVFIGLFVISLIIVLNIIPKNINAATKAKELENEKNRMEVQLKENRISLMLSQIRPHFIYNTLGTIERMCLKDPQKAYELVHNFSLYLRGNFSELDSVVPILFSEEIKHVEYYVNIEKVRFPDMNIEYHLEKDDFELPALSVQPLVENAIKHGLMKLESGGTINIRSFATDTHYCVEVSDNGVGFDFDADTLFEDKKHIGLRNIRERLKVMVNGELLIESELNVGTKAMIMIPKE